MRWLFVTVDFPWPLVKGYCVRVYNLSRALVSRGDNVSLLSFPGTSEQKRKYSEMGVTLIEGLRGEPVRRGKSRSVLGPFVYHKQLGEILADIGREFDIIALINSETLQYASEARQSGAFVLSNIADDPVLEVYRRLRSAYDVFHIAKYAKFIVGHLIYERKFVKYVDLLTFVSSVDAESFGRRNKKARVGFVANGVDVDYYKRQEFVLPEQLKSLDGPIVVFPGNMSHPPNVDAAEFIVKEIAPLVWRKRADVNFVLAGCSPCSRVRNLASDKVIVTGFVEDLRAILWGSDVVIIPMRIGTGIKNKLLEAWASECAVVASRRACQGIPARTGDNLLIGDNARELAENVLSLIEDSELRGRLARSGRETVVTGMRWDNTVERLYEYINSVRLLRGDSSGDTWGMEGADMGDIKVPCVCGEDCK